MCMRCVVMDVARMVMCVTRMVMDVASMMLW